MKYLEEFRDSQLAHKLQRAIQHAVVDSRRYRLMEFCGGHTHAIYRYGLHQLVPANVEFVHGPGCPVCVLPAGRVDNAIQLALQHDIILCTYADMLRVPGSKRKSLLQARAEGADVRMVYSVENALELARKNPDREVVFFAIGFETTTPPTAVALRMAAAEQLQNFSVFCNHVLTPAAMHGILTEEVHIDGFIGPSHVSTIIGSNPYSLISQQYRKPIVISGFEPLDVLQSVLMLVQQLNSGRFEVENEYSRAVTPEGNIKAQALCAEVFELREQFEWRGLGMLPHSALKIRAQFSAWDAELKFSLPKIIGKDVKACECPKVLRGQLKPQDCRLFAKECTPENPMGSCMVSSEGACAAWFGYGRIKKAG